MVGFNVEKEERSRVGSSQNGFTGDWSYIKIIIFE